MRTTWLTCLMIAASALVTLGGCRESSPVAEQPAAATDDELVRREIGSIKRLHAQGGVFLASQPSPDDFEQAKQHGVRTVISLRHPAEVEDFDAGLVVGELGLVYYNPAWNGPDELTDDIFEKLREMLTTADRPILLYCGSANRVGAVWMVHRALDDGLDVEDAVAEARTVGMRTPAYEAKAREYIARNQSG